MKNLFILELFVLVCLLISSSVLSAGDMYHVEKSAIVKEDLVLIGGHSCLMEGTVRGDAVIIGGNLELHGNVEGDAVVIGGDAQIYDGSHVKGDMVVISGKITREDGAVVDGDVVTVNVGPLRYLFKLIPSVTEFSTEQGEVKKIEKMDKIKLTKPNIKIKNPYHKGKMEPIWILLWGIALSTVIMLFTVVFPSGSETMTLYLEKRPGHSFLAGFLAQILFIPAILFLVLSVLGIPLIPLFMLAYPIALLIGLVPCSLFTGKRIARDSSSSQKRNPPLSFVGLFILFVLFCVGALLETGDSPLTILGMVISLSTLFIFYLYFTFGLGCLILSRVGTRKP